MQRRAIAIALAVMGGFTQACGGDSGSELEGIYQASTWTVNETGCAAEGPSVLAGEPETAFYVKQENLLGFKFLNAKFCVDVAECETLASDAMTIHIGEYTFDEGSDGEGWSSKWFAGAPNMANVCEGSFIVETMTGTGGQTVRIESRSTPASGFAPDQDGFCTDDEAAEAAAQGQPCARLEVITAAFVSGLP